MGLFDFLRAKQPENVPENKPKEIIIPVSSHEAEILNQNKPVISRGSIDAPADLCAGHFDFSDVLIAKNPRSGGEWYLLSGKNASVFAKDIDYINSIVENVFEYVIDAPDFCITKSKTALAPIPVRVPNGWIDWRFCKLFVDPFTETGKTKKYPVRISYEDTDGLMRGEFEYDKDGRPSKGGLSVYIGGYTSYKIDWIGGVLSHVKISDNKGETVLYNKRQHGNV